MFEIRELKVSVDDKEIIKGISLKINPGEVHAVMGPNGAGKSSFAEALMGHPGLEVGGSILLDSKELIKLGPDERARSGMFLAFQSPEEVEGVRVSSLVRKAHEGKDGKEPDLDSMMEIHKELVSDAEKLGMGKAFVSRDMNVGFSGGEKKRLEMVQMMSLKPKLIILDEVDSGLDVDGIKLISDVIAEMNDGTRSFIIITHYPRILNYVKPDRVHILSGGKIVMSGDEKLAHEIEKNGYAAVKENGH
jgi:Fe-S cluster assembly ATP-binding protein